MAEQATAVNNQATAAPTDSASADMSVNEIANQSFDMDESDFVDTTTNEDDTEVAPNKSDEPVKTPDGDDENDTDSEGDEVKDESEDTDDSEVDNEPTKGDKRKNDLNTEIRDLVAKRNELRKSVEEETAKAYQAQSIDELREEGLSDTDAKLEAMRQQMEIDKYNNQVAEAQLTIDSEASRVLRDFQIFDSESDSYNKELSAGAAALLEKNYIRDDNTNQVVGQHISTYDIYKLINDATTLGSTNGEIKGRKDAAKQASRVDTVGSTGPKTTKKDSGMDAFDAEFDRY